MDTAIRTIAGGTIMVVIAAGVIITTMTIEADRMPARAGAIEPAASAVIQ